MSDSLPAISEVSSSGGSTRFHKVVDGKITQGLRNCFMQRRESRFDETDSENFLVPANLRKHRPAAYKSDCTPLFSLQPYQLQSSARSSASIKVKAHNTTIAFYLSLHPGSHLGLSLIGSSFPPYSLLPVSPSPLSSPATPAPAFPTSLTADSDVQQTPPLPMHSQTVSARSRFSLHWTMSVIE